MLLTATVPSSPVIRRSTRRADDHHHGMPTVAPCQFSPGDMANRDAAMEVAAEGIAKLFHARAAIDAGIGAVREWDEEAASHLSEVSAPMDHALSNACATALGDHALAVHTMRAMCRMPNIDINETVHPCAHARFWGAWLPNMLHCRFLGIWLPCPSSPPWTAWSG
jgi:2-phospho-L-lactate transferase/gluconeogenesis factor (CofD/UPF0052 family)